MSKRIKLDDIKVKYIGLFVFIYVKFFKFRRMYYFLGGCELWDIVKIGVICSLIFMELLRKLFNIYFLMLFR